MLNILGPNPQAISHFVVCVSMHVMSAHPKAQDCVAKKHPCLTRACSLETVRLQAEGLGIQVQGWNKILIECEPRLIGEAIWPFRLSAVQTKEFPEGRGIVQLA